MEIEREGKCYSVKVLNVVSPKIPMLKSSNNVTGKRGLWEVRSHEGTR
jgi:hypothetical protein